MSTLHTVNKSPFSTQTLMSTISHALPGDAILMIEDGVYGAIDGSGMSSAVQAVGGNVDLYALDGDLRARGINSDRLIKGVSTIDYAGFVELAAKHDRTQAWL